MKITPDYQLEAQRRRAKALLRNGPDKNIYGKVCVATFVDPAGKETYAIWHLADSGTSWSSNNVDDPDLAWLGAEMLALRCKARLIDCGCREDVE